MIKQFKRRYLDLVGSIYVYNEHRGYTAIDRVLEAVRLRWPLGIYTTPVVILLAWEALARAGSSAPVTRSTGCETGAMKGGLLSVLR